MGKRNELRLVIFGIILVVLAVLIIWLIQAKKINPEANPNHAASFSLSPAVGNLEINKHYKLNIMIDSKNLESSGADALIAFDPNLVNIIDQNEAIEGIQVKTTGLYKNYFENSVDLENRLIRISAANSSKDPLTTINFPSVFATMEFVPIQSNSRIEFNFKFEKGKTSDCNVFENLGKMGEQDVLVGVLNGVYNLKDVF